MGSLPLDDALFSLNPDTFAEESTAVVDFLARYYRDIERYPVMAPDAKPGSIRKVFPDAAPETGESMDRILDDVQRDVLPGLTHWQSPSFFAYFQANPSGAGFAGEMLSAGLNVVPFMWKASAVATELEQVVVDWMAGLLGLPELFCFAGGGGGVLHGSTCEAVTHATFQKGARIVGIPPANFRVLHIMAESGYGLSADTVRAAVEEDVARGLVPLYLCATVGTPGLGAIDPVRVGTTGLGAIDPVRELGQVARCYGMWLHIDAAYAGSAAICPEFRCHLDGAELADSVSMNPHKWFLTNMDCCCLWVADPTALTSALSTDPEYLKNVGSGGDVSTIDYKDWQIALSRRFRAIKLWVVLRRYGAAAMRNYIRRHVRMAEWNFSLVCFRLRQRLGIDDDAVDGLNRQLLAAVNASGREFMTHFVMDSKFVIRLAVGGAMTEMRHVRDVWELLKDKANELVGGS
ncbi:unnamed protein product [Miscanthus lutarioriparius]|uniref:Uncharacterized protein n=1 Tax=Miscanthus lutarioriparius TaxID=422564 RepID=A0A811Q1E7_9POAL|nr:unnamed protein product [Miscanthus lutarioriparius]